MIVKLLFCLVGFACGVVYGVYGCKKDFGIPRGTHPNDGEWMTHDTLNKIYGYNCNRKSVSTEQ